MDIKEYERTLDDARTRFLSNIELPVTAPAALSRAASIIPSFGEKELKDDISAVVAGSSVVSFIGTMTAEVKQDVQDSLLFAQLAANKAFPDKELQRKEWFEHYNKILSVCGWTDTNDVMHKVTGLKQSFTMDQVVLDIVLGVVGVNKAVVDILSVVFKALKNTPQALNLFENETKSRNSGNFQVLPCMGTADGQVMMIKSCMQFNSASRVTKVLFWGVSRTLA